MVEDKEFVEEGVLGELFTDRDYKKIEYQYKNWKQPIYALKSASTDYDLTG